MGNVSIFNASAGCGKTEKIARKYIELIKKGLAEPQEVVAITYTEKAARELKNRIISIAKEANLDIMTISKIQNSHIKTVHSFCIHLLKFYWMWARLDTNFSITFESDSILFKLLNQHFSQNSLILKKIEYKKFFIEEYLNLLKDFMNEFINSLMYINRAKALDNDVSLAFDYLSQKIRSEFFKEITYDLVLVKTYELFKNKAIRDDINRRFKYLIVDEFQDSNFLQKSIFENVSQNVIYVGDKKQSIYRFQGAEPEVFDEVLADSDEIFELNCNFRTNANLGFKIDAICKRLFENYNQLEYHYDNDGFLKVVDILCQTKEATRICEAQFVAKTIKNMVESGYEISIKGQPKRRAKYSDFAILSRKIQGISNLYKEVFSSYGIALDINYKRGLLENKEILPLVGLFNVLEYPDRKSGYMMLLGNDIFKVNPFSVLFCESKDILNLLPDQLKNFIERSKKNLHIKKLSEILSEFEEMFEYSYKVYNIFGHNEFENVKFFYDMVDESGSFYLSELLRFLDNQNERVQLPKSQEDSVYMLSIHSAKGLSFPIVFLIGLGESVQHYFARSPKLRGVYLKSEKSYVISCQWDEKSQKNINNSIKEQDYQELKRLFYVAITRPMAGLYIINSSYEGKKKNTKTFGDIIGFESIKESALNLGIEYERYMQKDFEMREPIKNVNIIVSQDLKPEEIDHGNFQNRFNHLSPSHIMDFKYCKALFVLKYIMNLPIFDEGNIKSEIFQNSKVIGTVVHRVLELTTLDSLNTLEQNIHIAMAENDFYDYGTIKNLLDNYINSEFVNSIKPTVQKEESEVPFYLNLDNQIIYGIIDKTYHLEDEIYLIDFKTNAKFDDEKFKSYIPQLFIYSKAMSQRYPHKNVKPYIFWLRGNEIFEYKTNDKNYQDVINTIKEIRSIKTKKDVLNIIKSQMGNEHCNSCEFGFYCNDEQNIELIRKKLE